MPNDRVQLRPPRRYLAASGDLCSNPQNPLLEKAFDIRACVIDVPSVVNTEDASPLRAQRTQRFISSLGGEPSHCLAASALHCELSARAPFRPASSARGEERFQFGHKRIQL